jgi:hypothetical protein
MTEAPVPPRQPGSALEDVLPTAIDVLGDPRGFFSSMPREGGYEAPGIFAAVMLIAYAVLVAVFTLLRLQLVGGLVSLIVMPVVGAIGLLIASAVVLFLSRALGSDATFESSFRIVAYSSALLPIQGVALLIPYLPILVQAYGFYLLIVGVVTVHKVEEQKAWTVLGSIAAVMLVFSLFGTMAARRVAPRIDRLGHDLEKSAQELNRATDKFRRELDRANDQMKHEPPPAAR